MVQLVQLLSFVSLESFKTVNKTPVWLDKVILFLLSEFSVIDIMSWISDSPKHIIEFINKKIIQKYQYWINQGHDIHIIKD